MNAAAYIMVVLGILLAKGIGFLRDIVFASVFGASVYTDMYFQIFGLVNLIFTGIGVALSTLVIKNLNKTQCDSDEKKRSYVSHFITKTTLISLAAIFVMYLFSGVIVRLLLPGIEGESYGVALKMMYIMLPSFLFVIIAYIISGVLQNCRVFFISSIMSLPFNVVIIASLFIKNVDIVTVGIVTTIGWFLHIAVQLPSFYKKGYRLFTGGKCEKTSSGMSRELIWIFISNMMFQVCFMIDKAFVSGDSGAATTINYASNLFVTIASVFVVAMSNVVFPSISRNYEEGNTEYVQSLVKYIIVVMFVIFVPFILTVSCFGNQLIAVLYERGEFTPDLTKTTAVLFAIYTMGALGYVCQELFNKLLYLDARYSYTVAGTISVIALKIVLNLLSGGKVFVVAATTTLLFTLYAALIAFAMKKVIGNYMDSDLGKNLLKIIVSGICAFAGFIVCKMMLPELTYGRFTFLLPLALCAVIYIGVLTLSGVLKTVIKGRNADNPQ